ncbi:glycosyl transferase [Pseudoalteromonas luteoviolacea]|nr:glycosyl transferase [Pseudoalteromonas luteoviolacea]
MNVSVVGTVGVPACYGGFESLVENLLPSNRIGLVYCTKKAYSDEFKEYKGANLKYWPLDANGAQSIPYDVLSILHTLLFSKNNLLVLGVSGAIALPLFKLFTNRKVVTNIDGLEWKRGKWGAFAKWFLKFSEKVAVKYSDTVIADNAAIAEHVKSAYGKEAEVIAYGGDHAITGPISSEKKGFALALCRIEPENNVSMILEAYAKTPEKMLKFIGNWDNSEFGRQLKKKYASYSNIEIIDPIYDINKLFEIRSVATYYIHGHSAGGTNPSLVEMMFFGIPIYCFDCNYNRASTEDKAFYFSSASQLSELIKSDDGLSAISHDMPEIAKRRYTWKIVKQQYEDLFND